MFLLNYGKEAVTIELHREMTDLESGKVISGKKELVGYGVMVLGLE